jgi:integrase/recombinase XerC
MKPPDAALVPAPEVSISISPQGVLEAFLSGRNPNTLDAYRRDLEDFRDFLKVEGLGQAAAALLSRGQGPANALALSYRTHLMARRLSPATINRRIAALKSLVKLARLVGLVPFALEVQLVRDEKYRDTRGPGRDGVQLLLETTFERGDPKALRDRAIVRLLYDLALRRSEVIGLDLSHVDLKQKTISILGKGAGGRQLLTLPPETRDTLRSWMRVRGEEPGPLFTSFDRAQKGDGRLTPGGLYAVVRQLGKLAGLKVRPHGLRHAAITEALDATGGNVRAVQRFSRHKDLRILCVYDDARQDLAGEVACLIAKRT